MSENTPQRFSNDGGLVSINAEQDAHVDTIGTLILGLAFLILLLGYMRSQGRIRRLTEKLARLEAAN